MSDKETNINVSAKNVENVAETINQKKIQNKEKDRFWLFVIVCVFLLIGAIVFESFNKDRDIILEGNTEGFKIESRKESNSEE